MAKLPPLERPKPPEPEISGEWMYQAKGIIYGPVDAQTIVNKLYEGELTLDSPLAEGDADWITIADQPEFARYAARAKRELSEFNEELLRRRQAKKRRMAQLTFIVIPATGVLLLSIAIVAAVFIVKSKKKEHIENIIAWAERPPPVISLGTLEVKQVEERLSEEQKETRKRALTSTYRKKERRRKSDRGLQKTEEALASAAGQQTGGKPEEQQPTGKDNPAEFERDESGSEPTAAAANIREYLSDEEIGRVIHTKQKTLFPCIIQEAKENPLMPNNIVLEFTIENSGTVSNVSVENRELADGKLEKCFKNKMNSWKFPPYYGERRNVTLPFNISF
ncbi:MAG: hypothetical protein Kow0090_15880 [Myxococcota bacterium]